PLAAEGVLDEHVDLGRIEGGSAGVELVGELLRVQRLAQSPLGHIPELVRAELLLRSRGELEGRREAKRLELALDEGQRQAELIGDLVLPAEDVAVVLGQLSDAKERRQRAGARLAEERRI